ncbi:hypothetical protein EBH_0008370 [Eimeria brunetti]|uniref:Uncharacterized protein n=1 Tax=Eimeria brunetti TaxID=51314 RepID=U6LWS0_9EIME|nr:hypothetical protein EBH_0008370 [Eimeria brunetti]
MAKGREKLEFAAHPGEQINRIEGPTGSHKAWGAVLGPKWEASATITAPPVNSVPIQARIDDLDFPVLLYDAAKRIGYQGPRRGATD